MRNLLITLFAILFTILLWDEVSAGARSPSGAVPGAGSSGGFKPPTIPIQVPPPKVETKPKSETNPESENEPEPQPSEPKDGKLDKNKMEDCK